METSLGPADDISLVSISDSSTSSSCQKATTSFRCQMHIRRYLLFIVTLIAVVCLVLLSFSIVILIILFQQQTAISSLGKRLQALQDSGHQLEEELAHISNTFLLPQEKADQTTADSHRGKQKALDKRPNVRQTDPDFVYKPRKSNFSKMFNWNGTDISAEFEDIKIELKDLRAKLTFILLAVNDTKFNKEINDVSVALVKNISRKVLMEALSYLPNNTKKETNGVTFTCINKCDSVQMEMQGINRSLAVMLEFLTENKVQEEINRNVSSRVLQKVLVDQSLIGNVSQNIISNAFWREFLNVTMINNTENVMKSVQEVESNIRQMSRSMNRIEQFVTPLNETQLPVTPSMKNRTLCGPIPSQKLEFRDTEVVDRILNTTELQITALFNTQVKAVSELNQRFLRNQLNCSDLQVPETRDSYDSVKFCSKQDRCSTFKTNLKHCYKVSGRADPLLTWEQARDKCKELGGYLLEIDSNLEITEVERLSDRKQMYWLGGTDVEKEGLWIWQHSRRPIVLSSWKEGEPNNLNVEHCLQSVKGIRTWNDVPCSRKYRYICERNDGRCWD